MTGSEIGKKAEKKIREWLDRPQDDIEFIICIKELNYEKKIYSISTIN